MAFGGLLAIQGAPANTNAGADTPLTFSGQAQHWMVQNNTAATIYVDLDTAASTGAIALAPGTIWTSDIPVNALHVFTAAAQPVNAAAGVIVRGWV